MTADPNESKDLSGSVAESNPDELPLGPVTWEGVQEYVNHRVEVVNPPRLNPVDPEEAEEETTRNEASTEFPTPIGPAKFRIMFDPADPIGKALTRVPAVMAGVGWLLASGWTFGRAIEVPGWFATAVTLVPALFFVAAAPLAAWKAGPRKSK